MKAKTLFLIALALVFGGKAFGQEWEQSYEYYTSENEIKYISNLLGLNEMTVEEMRDMRNMVVIYYRHLVSGLKEKNETWDKYWNGMMSVTAIIDHASHGETA